MALRDLFADLPLCLASCQIAFKNATCGNNMKCPIALSYSYENTAVCPLGESCLCVFVCVL